MAMDEGKASAQVTEMLRRVKTGNREALDELFPIVYKELRRVAAHQLSNERENHTLQPTALVHEAYLRLIDQHSVDWHNRAHFFSIAAEMMRRILVNHAIEKKAQKRGSGETILSLEEISGFTKTSGIDLILLDEALKRLAEFDEQQAKIVELRFFGGLTIEETAHVLGISEATVNREWRSAKAWILAQLA
jgi:RNA polymerase sigma factor (TIGR02999 family)